MVIIRSNHSDKVFHSSSIWLTATAILQLAQKEKLNFNDLIGKHLKSIQQEIAEKITIHQILTHTEGCSSYFNKKYIVNRLQLKSVEDYLDLFINEPLLFEPGSKYQYSNSGFVILGAIIESISGQNYYDYIAEHIYKVARMSHSDSSESTNNNQIVPTAIPTEKYMGRS